MVKAIWNDVVLAESETFETVEGNIYISPGIPEPRLFYRKRDDHGLSLEGHGALILGERKRSRKQRRSVVLSGPEIGGRKYSRPCRVLVWRSGERITMAGMMTGQVAMSVVGNQGFDR